MPSRVMPRPAGPASACSSGGVAPPMLEHVAPRLLVHLGLEGEFGLERGGARRGGAGADLVMEALQVGELRPGIVAEDEGPHACPAPHRHIDDAVGLAHHVAMAREVLVEDVEMTLRLE